MTLPALNDRERRILEAVIQSYVETAEPTGSRSLARRFGFDVSPATIRNTMSDLEEKGYLYHPHTSAGRVPTDMAYRMYVDSLMRLAPASLPLPDHDDLMERLAAGGSAIEEADHAGDLQTSGRHRSVGDHVVGKPHLCPRD